MRPYNHLAAMWIALLRSLFYEEYQVQRLIADLADDNLDNASDAAQALGNSGAPEAVPALLAALAMTDTDAPYTPAQVDFRQDVVRALGRLGDERARPALVAVRDNDPDAGVRAEAATALRHFPPRDP